MTDDRACGDHGWSSFDQTRPLYLQGRVEQLQWHNPHAELAVMGCTFLAERGEALLRAEYFILGGKAYGLRPSPAKISTPRALGRRWWA